MSGSSTLAMRITPAGTSVVGATRTLGRVRIATAASPVTIAATTNTTLRLTSAIRPPTAGPMMMPAMMVDCIIPNALPSSSGGDTSAMRPLAAASVMVP